MNKIIKRIILIFTVICAMVLIVFSVELILLNRDAENEDAGPSVSGSPSPGNDNNGTGRGEPEASPPAAANGSGESPSSAEPAPPPKGTRIERLMPDDSNLVFYVDEESFTHTVTEMEDILDVFVFKGDGTADMEIRFVFMPLGVRAFADSFLKVNFEVEDSSTYGEESIRHSTLRGVFTSGTKSGTFYETWIYTFSDPEFDDMGIAFVINFQNETQRNALYDILDSLDMIS